VESQLGVSLRMFVAIDKLFNHPGLRKALVRVRVPLALLAAVATLAIIERRWLWAGLAVSLVGSGIQLWCFAALYKNVTLICQGPYAVVRNPMYLGRFFLLFGILMATGQVWLLVLFTVFYALYAVNRVKREEQTLAGIFGAEYATYCANVRRFLPGRPYHGNPVWVWDWSYFRRNHGERSLVGSLLFWAVAVTWSCWWRQPQ